MINTYTYEPTNLVKDQNGIVVSVQFTITASNGTDEFTVNSQTALPAPSADAIIPYDELSKEDVIAWIKKLVGAQSEELADSELEAFIGRKSQQTTTGTPW
jgi:hypothetical protein